MKKFRKVLIHTLLWAFWLCYAKNRAEQQSEVKKKKCRLESWLPHLLAVQLKHFLGPSFPQL